MKLSLGCKLAPCASSSGSSSNYAATPAEDPLAGRNLDQWNSARWPDYIETGYDFGNPPSYRELSPTTVIDGDEFGIGIDLTDAANGEGSNFINFHDNGFTWEADALNENDASTGFPAFRLNNDVTGLSMATLPAQTMYRSRFFVVLPVWPAGVFNMRLWDYSTNNLQFNLPSADQLQILSLYGQKTVSHTIPWSPDRTTPILIELQATGSYIYLHVDGVLVSQNSPTQSVSSTQEGWGQNFSGNLYEYAVTLNDRLSVQNDLMSIYGIT